MTAKQIASLIDDTILEHVAKVQEDDDEESEVYNKGFLAALNLIRKAIKEN
jgi:hypothetical protein